MDDNKKAFCNSIFKRFHECVIINIDVFGKERGMIMCNHFKEFIETTDCTLDNGLEPIKSITHNMPPS